MVRISDVIRCASYQIVKRNVETAWDAVDGKPERFLDRMNPIIDRWKKDPPDVTTINDFKKALKEVTKDRISLIRPAGKPHVYELQKV